MPPEGAAPDMEFDSEVPALDERWSVDREDERLIITSKDVFRCFINRAYDLKARKSVISAHMVLYSDKVDSSERLQFWNPDASESDDSILSAIVDDLRAVDEQYA